MARKRTVTAAVAVRPVQAKPFGKRLAERMASSIPAEGPGINRKMRGTAVVMRDVVTVPRGKTANKMVPPIRVGSDSKTRYRGMGG